jgi:hypothetical protein
VAREKLQARIGCESKQLKKVHADLKQWEKDRQAALPRYAWYNSHCAAREPTKEDRSRCQSETPKLKNLTATFTKRLAILEAARKQLEPALAADSKLSAQATCLAKRILTNCVLLQSLPKNKQRKYQCTNAAGHIEIVTLPMDAGKCKQVKDRIELDK